MRQAYAESDRNLNGIGRGGRLVRTAERSEFLRKVAANSHTPNAFPGGEALGAPAPVHQSGLHEKEVPLPAGPLFLVLNRSYRFGTITARKRVTEPVWLRMEWVWPSAQNSASPTCSSRLSPSSVTVAAPSRM